MSSWKWYELRKNAASELTSPELSALRELLAQTPLRALVACVVRSVQRMRPLRVQEPSLDRCLEIAENFARGCAIADESSLREMERDDPYGRYCNKEWRAAYATARNACHEATQLIENTTEVVALTMMRPFVWLSVATEEAVFSATLASEMNILSTYANYGRGSVEHADLALKAALEAVNASGEAILSFFGGEFRAAYDEAIRASRSDVERSLSWKLGKPPKLGKAIDPGETGILGALWPPETEDPSPDTPFDKALARINFRDDKYIFLRAIDGDTISVAPPPSLRPWMKDVRVRLYGIETPELWEELGPEHQQYLHDICAIDADARLNIVWERERFGTMYEGYPLTTFERGIGHVFFESESGEFIYINGMLHILRGTTLFRKGKMLLRGRAHLRDYPFTPHGRCQSPFPVSEARVSDAYQMVAAQRPPICLLTYPALPSLRPQDIGTLFPGAIEDAAKCEVVKAAISSEQDLQQSISDQKLSPFDIPLLLLSRWATMEESSPIPTCSRGGAND